MTYPRVFLNKVRRVMAQRIDAFVGRFYSLPTTLEAMARRPYELHLELTNLCNANCVFCPYQFQTRPTEFMSDRVLRKAVDDFVRLGGGSVGLTPIVGDALIDPRFVERVRELRRIAEIDRIWLTTNGILLDKHGIDEVLDSGLTSVTISTAGFDEEMYRRVYRSQAYGRMRRNVTTLLERNAARAAPIPITISLRPDRPLGQVMKDPDLQPILALNPLLDFTWSFTSAGGRISRSVLPLSMKLRVVSTRREPCVQLYNGPIVLPDGTVMACSCVAAMDAVKDLGLGNVLDSDLGSLWGGVRMTALRAEFVNGALNSTCANCDMFRGLDLYRMREGRERARINRLRHQGIVLRREERPTGYFSGG